MARKTKIDSRMNTRRRFIKNTGLGLASTLTLPTFLQSCLSEDHNDKVKVNAHLWVYASKYPPNWDCTPDLETIFSDLSYAGIDGLELMEVILRHDDAVDNLNLLRRKYNVNVSGSSYGVGFNMWNRNQHEDIVNDLLLVLPRLRQVGGETFGISVGGADHHKTEEELDAQAELLLKVRELCEDNGIEANLHNHTYEVENDMHDLKGTLARIPDFKLGPDLNWLVRGGVDPVAFINTYGKQITYLHIRDQYDDGTWTEYVGQGNMDFPAMAAALKEQGFNGQAAIELAFPDDFTPENSLKEDWKLSRDYIRKVFGW
jgi:sugar phosphate isomerase/epimerase